MGILHQRGHWYLIARDGTETRAYRVDRASGFTVGEKAGMLYAISTLGSFLGCMATSFYLIVWMGINHILLLHAVVLAGAAVGFWGVWHLLPAPLQSSVC